MEMKKFLLANWDRALAVALIVAGVAVLIVGWFGVSGTGLVAEQNPYLISAGLGGIALLIVGCTVWLSSDLQDEWRRMDAIEGHLERIGMSPAVHDQNEPTPEREEPTLETEISSNGSSPEVPAPAPPKLTEAARRRSPRTKEAGTPTAARRKTGRSQAEPS